MQPDERDRLTRVETKLDYVISHMSSLPPSPETIERLERIEQRQVEHHEFISTLKERIAWITAAFSTLGVVGVYAIKYAFDNIKIGWGN
jgi:hypothetical protein